MSRAIGVFGEDLASRYIQQKGFTIIKRNFYSRFGEVDIIAQNGEYIVFIEVKTRKVGSVVSGLEAIDMKKQKRIIKTAMMYLSANEPDLQPRFDVIGIEFEMRDGCGLLSTINYIEDAFCWRDEYNETF